MFEDRTDILREHIAYLEEILAEDYDKAEEVDSEELKNFLETCQEDINNLKEDLPYDEIEEDDIPIEDFSDDYLDDSEIEDEVVEVENVIQNLQELMEAAKKQFLEEEEVSNEEVLSTVKSSNLSETEFYQRLKEWLTKEIRIKLDAKGLSKSDDEIAEMCSSIIEGAAVNRANPYPHFSIGLFHITFEMIKMYRLIGHLLDFDQELKFQYSFWGNLV